MKNKIEPIDVLLECEVYLSACFRLLVDMDKRCREYATEKFNIHPTQVLTGLDRLSNPLHDLHQTLLTGISALTTDQRKGINSESKAD